MMNEGWKKKKKKRGAKPGYFRVKPPVLLAVADFTILNQPTYTKTQTCTHTRTYNTHRQQRKQETRAGITFWYSPSYVEELRGDRGWAKPPLRWVRPPSKKKKKKKG